MGEMNSPLKTILKVTAAALVPGIAIYLLASMILRENEKKEFKRYIYNTYGEGSKYVDTYY
jgi:hypothetical protein